MPFYEYQCAACGRHHEELQKVTDRPLRKCPHCGRPSLKRLVSAPVFRLKGGGWYETDFKKDQEAKRNLAGDKEPAVEQPKEAKSDAVKDGAIAKAGADAKAPAADAKTRTAGDSKAPVRKKPARRRARK